MKEKLTIHEIVVIAYCSLIVLEIWFPVDAIFVLIPILVLGFSYFRRLTITICPENKILMLLLFFILYYAFTLFWTPHIQDGAGLIKRYIALYLVLFLMTQVNMSERAVKLLLNSMAIAGIVLSIICVFWGNIKYGRLELLDVHGGVAADPNTICSWLIIPSAIFVQRIFQVRKQRMVSFAAVILFLYVAVLTESRGGIISIIIAICIMALSSSKGGDAANKAIRFVCTLLLVILFAIVLASQLPADVLERFAHISSFGGRRNVWEFLIETWKSSFSIMLFGAGASSVSSYTGFLIAHNIFIKFLFETGLVGMALWLIYVFSCIVFCHRRKNTLGLAVLLAMLVISCTLDTDTYKPFWLVLYLVLLQIDNRTSYSSENEEIK